MKGRAAAAVLALAAVLAWLTLLQRDDARTAVPADREAPAAAPRAAATAVEPVGDALNKFTEPSVNLLSASPRYAGPGPDDPAGPGMLPHPITPEHRRMYRDVDLIDGAWQALERRDFARARELLREHATEYAGGYDDLQEGMSILAECMEHPGAEIRERAQRFYDTHTASTARRQIRRRCLEQVSVEPARGSDT